MMRIPIAWLICSGFFWNSVTYASSETLAKELHRTLNVVDWETQPSCAIFHSDGLQFSS
jgi:hypothetical protein